MTFCHFSLLLFMVMTNFLIIGMTLKRIWHIFYRNFKVSGKLYCHIRVKHNAILTNPFCKWYRIFFASYDEMSKLDPEAYIKEDIFPFVVSYICNNL